MRKRTFLIMTSFVVYASSTDSKNIFTDNNPNDFIVQLDRNINLCAESYVELLDIRCRINERTKEEIYIFSDVCQESFLYGKLSPVLRVFQLPGLKVSHTEFVRPIKLKTIQGQLNRFRIYIKPRETTSPPLSLSELNVTLRFHNVSY
jgi:hypothetical protein